MYDIVILDTGLNTYNNEEIKGFSINTYREPVVIYGDIMDYNGHGTIIHRIISKYSPSSSILIIKIFNDNRTIDETDLVFALKYIKENVSCRIINMSLGLRSCYDINSLKKICTEITNSDILIVAAFDNDNCHSYPACFKNVIGVDSNDRINSIYDFEYVESSPVNIRAKGSIQRIKLDGGKTVIVSGSSIACAHITAYIANSFKDDVLTHERVLAHLKEHAVYVYHSTVTNISNKNKMIELKNVALFPINKEMHAFIRFNDMLKFKVHHYYDVRHSGRVGMKINRLYANADDNICIEDIDKATFEDIDTIVIGHLDELNALCRYDLRENIIRNAVKKGINIYSFDLLNQYSSILRNSNINYFTPSVSRQDVPQNTFGKLYRINKPVVSIHGTSSRQGKFSLQLSLKRMFEANDYYVGSIGSEPHSFLFNMDIIYPMGYNTTVFVDSWQSITYLNSLMHQLCEDDVEIIIAASQSGSAPQNYNNLSDFPIRQNTFIMGVQPDVIILCINAYDEISYIKNTIQLLQGLSDAEVIALVMYPLTVVPDMNNKKLMSKDEFEQVAVALKTMFGLPVYLLGYEEHMLKLYQDIIDYF